MTDKFRQRPSLYLTFVSTTTLSLTPPWLLCGSDTGSSPWALMCAMTPSSEGLRAGGRGVGTLRLSLADAALRGLYLFLFPNHFHMQLTNCKKTISKDGYESISRNRIVSETIDWQQ
jgi:hypothetical protein